MNSRREMVFGDRALLSLAFTLLCLACTPSRTAQLNLGPPTVVDSVDLSRYSGKWYEISRLPNAFQKGCSNTTATYRVLAPGKISVVNECSKTKSAGKKKATSTEGTARVVPQSGGAKLKVSFFWPFEGDYWVLHLEDDYSVAAVGTPSRNYLWILSRTPTISEARYQALARHLADQGFQTSELIKTNQSSHPG